MSVLKNLNVSRRIVGVARSIILSIIVLLSIVYMANRKSFPCVVYGESMQPTFTEGDKIIAVKPKENQDVDRYCIAVVKPNRKSKNYLIKRVVGLPNESIRIDDDGKVYANGCELIDCYKYWKEPMDSPSDYTIELGEDEYFVLGDNTNHSLDSRSSKVGAVKKANIVGIVEP